MSPPLLWYLGSLLLAALALLLALGLLSRLLNALLLDLLGTATRARFFTLLFCAALVSVTLAGALAPASLLDLEAQGTDQLIQNSSIQLLVACGALLSGLGCVGGFLLRLVQRYEAQRA